jgi:hypothetical protein
MPRDRKGNGAIETLAGFLDHIEREYGEAALTSVSQSDLTSELLKYLWVRGYKITPLEQGDYDVN